MTSTRDLWGLVKELDLESIRHEAERTFRIAIAAETSELGARLVRALTGDVDGPAHPWLEHVTEDEPDGSDDVVALIVATRDPLLPPDLARVRARFIERRRPVIVAVIDGAHPADLVARGGETARLALPIALDQAAVGSFAAAMVDALSSTPELALARQLPPFRASVFARLIERTSRANAAYALTTGLAETVPVVSVPLNLADIVVLTKNQLVMAYKIALGAGKSGRPQELIGEIIAVIGSGFLLRQGARQLVGLVPIVGIVPKIAIAYAGTWAVGRAMTGWALHGQQMSAEVVSRFYEDARRRGREIARRLVRQERAARAR